MEVTTKQKHNTANAKQYFISGLIFPFLSSSSPPPWCARHHAAMQHNTQELNIANRTTPLEHWHHSYLFTLSVFICWWKRAKDIKAGTANSLWNVLTSNLNLKWSNALFYNIWMVMSVSLHLYFITLLLVLLKTHILWSSAEIFGVVSYVLLILPLIDLTSAPKSNLICKFLAYKDPEVTGTRYWSLWGNTCSAFD